MNTVSDLKEGDKVWAYDHGKIHERTVKKMEFLQDELGDWYIHISLTRCIPYKLYGCYGSMEDAKKWLEWNNRNYGYFFAASQKIWTNKDELKKWLEKTSTVHRELYHKYARRARREEIALDKMKEALSTL